MSNGISSLDSEISYCLLKLHSEAQSEWADPPPSFAVYHVLFAEAIHMCVQLETDAVYF